MKKIYYAILLLSANLVFQGCTKEGPIGPEGPVGPSGSANVKTVVSDVEWVANTSNSYRAVIANDNLTADIVNKGTVIVSMSNNKQSWIPMPYSNSVIGFYIWYDVGSLTITSVNLTPNNFDEQYLYKHIKISTIE